MSKVTIHFDINEKFWIPERNLNILWCLSDPQTLIRNYCLQFFFIYVILNFTVIFSVLKCIDFFRNFKVVYALTNIQYSLVTKKRPTVTRFWLWSLCVPQLTQARFFQKNKSLQNVFLISVMLRWHSDVKDNEIWTFKVNFLCQKMSESFYFFFHLQISIKDHIFCKIHFLMISIFKSLYY